MAKENTFTRAKKYELEMNEDEMKKEGINAEVSVDESSGEVNIELKAK